MVKHSLLTFAAIALLLAARQGASQQCLEFNGFSDSAETDTRFALQPEGTVIDRLNHLVWKRCSAGQHWDAQNNACAGEAQTVTWYQASRLGQGWRLPSVHELSSIVQLRCFDPAIDLRIFPNTPASHYWTGTAFASQPGQFWLLQFFSGENHTDSGKRLAHARLVRDLD